MNAASDDHAAFRPCLILAHADAVYAVLAAQAFRRQGWDVYTARTGPEVRRLARMLRPHLVVLEADFPGESGWLTCDKLTGEFPRLKVVLVGADSTPFHRDFAAFVGAAALVRRDDGVPSLLPHFREPALPAVG